MKIELIVYTARRNHEPKIRDVSSEKHGKPKTSEPKDMGSTRDEVPTTGDTHRTVSMWSCGIGLSHHALMLILASRTIRAPNATEHVGTRSYESTTFNMKRAQPLSKKSDDRTQSVGCFRTACRAWSSSPTDANVCFTTRVRVCLGLAGIGKAAEAVGRQVPENNRKLERCDCVSLSLFYMRTCCTRSELTEDH